jgi:hypothetical protein
MKKADDYSTQFGGTYFDCEIQLERRTVALTETGVASACLHKF